MNLCRPLFYSLFILGLILICGCSGGSRGKSVELPPASSTAESKPQVKSVPDDPHPLQNIPAESKLSFNLAVNFDPSDAFIIWSPRMKSRSPNYSTSTSPSEPTCILKRSIVGSALSLDPKTPLNIVSGLTGIEVEQSSLRVWQVLSLRSNEQSFTLRCEKPISKIESSLVTTTDLRVITSNTLYIEAVSALKSRWQIVAGEPSSAQLFSAIAPGARITASNINRGKEWFSEWQDGIASGESTFDPHRVAAEVRIEPKTYKIKKTKIFYSYDFSPETVSKIEIVVDLDDPQANTKKFIEWTLPLNAPASERNLSLNSFLKVFPNQSISIEKKPLNFNIVVLD